MRQKLDDLNLGRKLVDNRAWVGLAVFVAIAGFTLDTFLTTNNLLNIARQGSVMALLAAGMTFVIITRGIDLSVGAILALAGIAFAAVAPLGLPVALLVAIIVGAGAGFINGVIITYMRIDPFVTTIATMFAFRGLALLITSEDPLRIDSEHSAVLGLGRGKFLEIPIPVLVVAVLYVALTFAAKRVRLGRAVYALGGNAAGAEMMGLPVRRAKVSVYVLSGMMAGIAGALLASRMGAGQPTAGELYDLNAIAAVIIGGTLLSGGAGKLSGTLAGVLLISGIANVFNLQGGLSTWWQNALNGAILLSLIVGQAALTNRRAAKRGEHAVIQ